MSKKELRLLVVNEHPDWFLPETVPRYGSTHFFHKWVEKYSTWGSTNYALIESIEGEMREVPHERIKFTD
jgi:hypothetical protein